MTALTTLRVLHSATPLDDGRVLIAGGVDTSGNVLSAAEVFDPKTGIFTAVGGMTNARAAHTATKLPGGLVLIAGGTVSSFAYPAVFGGATKSTEIFDPVANTFKAGPNMLQKRLLHSALPIKAGGKDYVLMMSGFNGLFLGLLPTYTATAEVYDVTGGAFKSSMGSVSVGNLRSSRGRVRRGGAEQRPRPGRGRRCRQRARGGEIGGGVRSGNGWLRHRGEHDQ